MQATKTTIYFLLLLWASQTYAQSNKTVSIRILEVNAEERDYTYSSHWNKYGAVIIKAEIYNRTKDSVHLLAHGGRYHKIQPNFWAVEGRRDSLNSASRADYIPPPPPGPRFGSGDPFVHFMRAEWYISIAPNESATVKIDSDISETYFGRSGNIYVRINYQPEIDKCYTLDDAYWDKFDKDHPKRPIMEAIREKVYPLSITSNWFLVERP